MTNDSSTIAPRSRNREQTEAAIVDAARGVLAEQGFQALGINAIARRAGCDKQLIYRYFGGLDGLIEAVGEDLARWFEDSVAAVARPESYGAFVERFMLDFLEALRANPLVQNIAAWELAAPSPLVARLSVARGKGLARWVETARGDLQWPEGIDAPALNAVLIAAVQHLVLSAQTTKEFASVPLRTESDWDRIRDAVRHMVRAVYPA